MREYLPVQRGQQVDIRDAEVGASDLLVDHAGGETAQPQAAELFGQLGSNEAHRAHLLHYPAVEDARPVALLKAGGDAIGRKSPRLVGERNEVVVEIGVHQTPL